MLELRKINYDVLPEVLELRARPEQEQFTMPVADSLLEAFAAREDDHTVLPFGLYDGDTAVALSCSATTSPMNSAFPPSGAKATASGG